MDSQIDNIALSDIRENPVALRGVNKESEHYLGLVASIKEMGFNGTISVRPATDSETGADYFEIIDGLHRFNAAGDAGLEVIPCTVMRMDKMQVLETQLMMNVHKVDTRPIEFTHQLSRMMALNPALTMPEVAAKLGKSPAWINTRLGLLKLTEGIQAIVDDTKITLSNAFTLAKLPIDEQEGFVERAMTMVPAQFAPEVNRRVKEIREARKAGRAAGDEVWAPSAFLQKKPAIEAERESCDIMKALISEAGVTTAVEGASIALDWILNLDTKSVSVQKSKYDERERGKKERAEARKLEAANKKADAAAAIADSL